MNKEQITGAWDQVMGKAKQVWGGLTEDDLKRAEGSVEKLYGVIQQRFGDSKDVILKKLKDLGIK